MWITSPSSSPDLRHTNTRNPETIESLVLYEVIWEDDGHQRSNGWAIVSPFITTFCHITWSTNRPLCYTYWFWTTSHSLFWLCAIISFSIKMQPVYYSLCILMWAGRHQQKLATASTLRQLYSFLLNLELNISAQSIWTLCLYAQIMLFFRGSF